MKLLLDQDLSQRLIACVRDHFPDSRHVKDFGLTGDDDETIWRFAAQGFFVLVSKDADFLDRSLQRGYPPKFVYVRSGNCSTGHITDLLVAHVEQIKAFVAAPAESVLFRDGNEGIPNKPVVPTLVPRAAHRRVRNAIVIGELTDRGGTVPVAFCPRRRWKTHYLTCQHAY